MSSFPDLSITTLLERYRERDLTPRALVTHLRERIAAADPAIWITPAPEEALEKQLIRLESLEPESLPLYGIPFAIKDNIDLAQVPTTAACPEYAYTPEQSAPVVDRLLAAGALPMGKTNLDQFATGLVGVRSPYGVPANAFDAEYIPGGSSSGSAVAVAGGLVTFSLGTDTAGSGRIPASFNNLIGLKPTRGLLSCRGVVPACRSLDCVSIFALHSDDARTVFDIANVFDPKDDFARPDAPVQHSAPDTFTFGIPRSDQLEFFGNASATNLFIEAADRLESLGGIKQIIDFSPFLEAALLLYEGPWVTERYLAIEDVLLNQPEILNPITRKIIEGGASPSAADAFQAQYRLRSLKRRAEQAILGIDVVLTPTAGTTYTRTEVEADPIELNSNLGRYTNFMNLLDFSAINVPAGFLECGIPFGVTLFAPAFSDHFLLDLAAQMHHAAALPIGCGNQPVPAPTENRAGLSSDWIEVVVCGAHMKGLPLNHQLTDRGGRFIESTHTAPTYRLYALPATETLPPRPGLIRCANEGAAIEVEIWALLPEHFGTFVESIPPPLGIGKIELEDQRHLSGFLCEPFALEEETPEITHLGGWRRFLASQ